MSEDSYSESSSGGSESTNPRRNSPSSGSLWLVDEDQQTVISKGSPLSSTKPTMQSFRPSEVGETLEGVQLGHFLLEQYVGGGGMGAVFRGKDTTLGRVVAIKVVSSRNTDSETLLRFRNEAQSAARLDHPNIARVYFVGEDQGWNFIVFEFIDGVNVRALVERDGPLSMARSLRYTLHVAAALAHAADREVVHRDIKPSNILVTGDGQAKLVDMGLARLHQVEAPAQEITESGVTLGTFDYISPEQASDPRSADVRSDLYSLGCTLYFMLTGAPPFPDGTVLQKLLSHSSKTPKDVREIRPSLGGEAAAILSKLMAKQPAQRYQSPQELISDLVAAADALGLEGISQAHYPSLQRPSSWQSRVRWHLPWLIPIALLLVAGAAMHTVWNRTPPSALVMPPRPRLGPVDTAPPLEPPETTRPQESQLSPGEVTLPASPRSAIDAGPAGLSPLLELGADPPYPIGDSFRLDQPLAGSTPVGGASEPDPRAVAGPRSTAGAAGATVLPITTIVVGSSFDGPPGPGEQIVNSLELAVQRAAEIPEVDTIELRFDQREAAPVTVDLRRALTIRAGDGYRPTLSFRPRGGLIPEWRMFRLQGDHDIRFEGIHCLLELPADSGPPSALFDLNQINLISLSDCTLTIRNPAGAEAAFFSVHSPAAPMAGQSVPIQRRSPSIELHRVIARGQATLLRANEGLPARLTWEQGLLATTERLVEAGGLPDHSGAEIVRVDLTNVTAAMDRGLCRVTVDDSGPFLPAVDIQVRDCVVTHLVDFPLVEHVGVTDLEDAEGKFRYAGQHNYYESTEIRWRVVAVRGETYYFEWGERDGFWYEERFAVRAVRWRDEYRVKPGVSFQTPVDYLVDEGQGGGFDVETLPEPPDNGELVQ